MAPPKFCVFSDIDGTLVHYEETEEEYSYKGISPCARFGIYEDKDGKRHMLLALPPSSSGMQGYISLRTLQLIKGMREAGARFVLVSGGRSSTCLQRLPYLPEADGYVMENGGRVFERSGDGLVNSGLLEDAGWRANFLDTVGPPEQDRLQPADRKGRLWDVYRRLVEEGFTVDTNNYFTSIRVKVGAEGAMREKFDEIAKALPAGLKCAWNLGMCDVMPSNSGKESAVAHVMGKLGLKGDKCACLCDDDNDLGMCEVVGHAYLPSVTADSIAAAAKAKPSKFTIAKTEGRGPMATDEVCEALYRKVVGKAPPKPDPVPEPQGAGGGGKPKPKRARK